MNTPARVRVVLSPAETGWILGKFARRMVAELQARGVDADQDAEPDPLADVNHWIYYIYFQPRPVRGIHTVMITHVDSPARLAHVKQIADFASAGICFSTSTREFLAARGVAPTWLPVVLPASDGTIQSRRIRIGITTRLYADGRKGEDRLAAVAEQMSLADFQFDIVGAGWTGMAERLRRAGALVRWQSSGDPEQDYAVIAEWLPECDYYMYLGEDEGSMGYLDALAAGLPTIATPQGFHLDILGGPTHPVSSAADLAAALTEIARPRAERARSVSALSWARYVDEHLGIWRRLGSGVAAASEETHGHTWSARDRYDFFLRPYIRHARLIYRRIRDGRSKP